MKTISKLILLSIVCALLLASCGSADNPVNSLPETQNSSDISDVISKSTASDKGASLPTETADPTAPSATVSGSSGFASAPEPTPSPTITPESDSGTLFLNELNDYIECYEKSFRIILPRDPSAFINDCVQTFIDEIKKVHPGFSAVILPSTAVNEPLPAHSVNFKFAWYAGRQTLADGSYILTSLENGPILYFNSEEAVAAFVRDLPELLVKNGLGLPYENVPREELFKREPVF